MELDNVVGLMDLQCDYCQVVYQVNGLNIHGNIFPEPPLTWELDLSNGMDQHRCPACVRQNTVLTSIVAERQRQDRKWGVKFSNSAERWLAILAEEFGEVAMAVVDRDYDQMEKELVQTAAVCVKFLEFFDRNKPVDYEAFQ